MVLELESGLLLQVVLQAVGRFTLIEPLGTVMLSFNQPVHQNWYGVVTTGM